MTMVWRRLDEKSYRKKIEEILVGHEGDVPFVYIDSEGIPTVGPGKALIVENSRRWRIDSEAIEMLENVTGRILTKEQLEKLGKAREVLDRNGRGRFSERANGKIFYKVLPRSQRQRVDSQNGTFGVNLSENEQRDFKNRVIADTERKFDQSLQRPPAVKEGIPPSEERIALISIYHHCPACVGPVTRQKINDGDRAGVVFEIEYRMDKDKKFPTRRKEEADQFGRPDNPDVIRNENNSQRELEEAVFKKSPAKMKLISKRYIWRTAGDDKVRPEHAAREGLIFERANPPSGGNPGEAYGCRCWAEDIPDELEQRLGDIFKR